MTYNIYDLKKKEVIYISNDIKSIEHFLRYEWFNINPIILFDDSFIPKEKVIKNIGVEKK